MGIQCIATVDANRPVDYVDIMRGHDCRQTFFTTGLIAIIYVKLVYLIYAKQRSNFYSKTLGATMNFKLVVRVEGMWNSACAKSEATYHSAPSKGAVVRGEFLLTSDVNSS